MPILEVNDLSVGYSVPVAQNISFSLARGEVVGLLGRNGSGKTTLLRGLTGSAKVFGGTVGMQAGDILSMKPRQRARYLSLLSQRTGLMAGLRAGEVIAMGRYAASGAFGGPAPGDEALCRKAACSLGIENLWDRDCALLSEGQRQLVQLARVTAQNADILLLDEPSSALDFENSRRLFSHVQGLCGGGKSALVVIHDPALALRWCDRLLRLEEGRLTGVLSPKNSGPGEAQVFLRQLYPGIAVRRDPESGCFYCIFP